MKICPKCKKNHSNTSNFCSRSCANSRKWNAADKKKKSQAALKFYETDAGIKRKKKISLLSSQRFHSEKTKEKISNSCKIAWTDEMRYAASIRSSQQKHTEKTKQTLSIIAKKRNFGGHTSKRKIFFKKNDGSEVYLQSSYEIDFAKLLEKMNIKWERPTPLVWVDQEGIDHKYYPDFKIGNIYIDVKNDYLAEKDLPKITAVIEQNNVDIRIVRKKDINEVYIRSLV